MPEATALQASERNETGPTRRTLLQVGIATAGGLLLVFHLPFAAGAIVCFAIHVLNTARLKAHPELAKAQ